MWKVGKSHGLARRTFVNRKRREILVLGTLIFLIRHFWQNGYGEWSWKDVLESKYGSRKVNSITSAKISTNLDDGMIYPK